MNNQGYLSFKAGGKNYYCHRFVYEVFNGSIKDGFVIDHIDRIKTNNSLSNLQAISQRENTKRGGTGKYSKNARPVRSFNTENNTEIVFQSINAAGMHFDICPSSVQKVAEGVYKTAFSKRFKNSIQFVYVGE